MSYQFLQSRWFTPGPRRGPVNKVVLHTMEAPCVPGEAKICAQIAAVLPDTRKVSAHFYADPNEVWQGVRESDIAYAAPGANNDGIQIEQAGYAAYTTGDWSAPSEVAMCQIVAALIADISVRWNIPLRFCSAADMLADPNAKGITTHAEVNQAFHLSNHTDPGPKYPLDYVLIEARAHFIPPEEDDMPARTIRKTSTGAIEVYANGVAAPFHFADPNDAARNVATINRLAAKGLITVPWIELDDDEFDCIPRFKTS